MRSIIEKILRLCKKCVFIILPLLLSCSVQGPGQDISGIVAGRIYNQDGTPAENAAVFLRPYNYLPIQTALAKRMAHPTSLTYSAITDMHGDFIIKVDSTAVGQFVIEAVSQNKDAYLLNQNITIDEYFIDTKTWIDISPPKYKNRLQPPCTISESPEKPDSAFEGSVYVFGLDVYTSVQQDGSFTLANVPEGRLRILIQYILLNGSIQNDTMTVTAKPQTTELISDSIPITFIRSYSGQNAAVGNSVQQTTDGGYIFSGTTWPFHLGEGGNSYIYALKTNSYGDTLWTKTYGDDGFNYGEHIQHTIDDGYIIVGSTSTASSESSDVHLFKTAKDGTVIWNKTYGYDDEDIGSYVQQTNDGGYIVIGQTWVEEEQRLYLLKTDVNGDSLWTKTSQFVRGYGNSVKQTSDGGYIYTEGGSGDIKLVKITSDGTTEWFKTFGNYDSFDDSYDVVQTTDGGYVLVGYFQVNSQPALADVCLIKTDSTGQMIWHKTYGGQNSDIGHSVQQTKDGGFIITGWTNSFGSETDVYLIKTNHSGDTLWTRTIGGPVDDEGYSVQQTTDGGYIIVGLSNSFNNTDLYNILLIKTDENGNVYE